MERFNHLFQHKASIDAVKVGFFAYLSKIFDLFRRFETDIVELMNNNITFFALTNYRNINKKFGIKKEDRRKHVYLIGKTGMGKSTALENIIYSDIQAGNGLAVIDPHGDLAVRILSYIPSHRINETIYFNPGDTAHPIAFNVLEKVDPVHRHLVASGLVGVFKKIWADSWGPRLEYVLRNSILALLENPGNTLLGIPRLLTDPRFRERIIKKVADPVVKAFWRVEYESYPKVFRAETISPIQNKVGQFLSSFLIRNIVGQTKSKFDLRDIIDNHKILICNLSKGKIGEDNSALLGALIITKLHLATMSRVDTEESKRKDFYLFVDEFQNFATESFANILSEARKYRLNLTICNQYLGQLDEQVKSSVFGNIGTLISFRVGSEDSEFLSQEFYPPFTQTDLQKLPKYDIYLKLMIDGVASDPFSATTLPPPNKTFNNQNKIIEQSRQRYSNPRKTVEQKISKWKNKEYFTGEN